MEIKTCISCNLKKHINEFAFSKGKPREKCKKCTILCRNCHSEFHYLEKENGITIMEYIY